MSNPPTWSELAGLYANAAIKAEVQYRKFKEAYERAKGTYEDFAAMDGENYQRHQRMGRSWTERAEAVKAADWFRSEAVMYAQLSQMAWLYREE